MMYVYGNNCSVNNECESGYSLYFPCIKTITRGENACFDFYIVDNSTKQEVDLREVNDITLNLYGRYNCNFGSFSYPENINFLQIEKFSDLIYNIDFSNIIKKVNLYIDIIDENNNLIESHIFDENLLLDISIDGDIGYFLKGSTSGILNLKGYDTKSYIFLGWNIDESDSFSCDIENIYDFLIKTINLTYNISDNCTVRAVYQKRLNYIEDNFTNIYPNIRKTIFVDNYFIENIYINNCEINVLNDISYIKIINDGYIKLDNIYDDIGTFKLSINKTGEDCVLFVDNYEVIPFNIEKNEFIFEYEGETIIITGNNSCIFGLKINKEVIYQKGKCMFCLNSDETLKLHPGDLVVDGGVIVNENPYGISKVKFSKVTDITPLNIKK